MRPILFQYRHKNQVQFVDKNSLLMQAFGSGGLLDDKTDNEVPDTYALKSAYAVEVGPTILPCRCSLGNTFHRV
jgi:hypothetical protein